MGTQIRQHDKDIAEQVLQALNRYPELVRQIPVHTLLHRVQPSRYDANPINYRANSDTRYADPAKQVGVYYLGFSEEVAVAESFQPGQGVDDQQVRLSQLEQTSLHQLKAARNLSVVDVAALANRATHHKVRDIVQAKGQGRQGYALPQKFSQACMQLAEIDGLLYQSAVYTVTGSMNGCNLVLFEGRTPQVEAMSHRRVMEAVFSNGETAIEFLDSLGVALE
ncbi:RES family NAD+ phosphorylase [Pseudomonas sp. p106]|uniref:RES family NAD+ phosphorylase n=1 Tax=Pseudomonas sp. p106 TaxID=2479854 RepID=UPI000F76A2DC|nr:RES family NAD+ phosphorylase [Pseudomonas sp. p106]RRV46200.1 RES domain-containing protein [Pseudomonas sp. p106]